MLDCDQVLELLSAQIDGALTAEESAALEEHLAACPACRALLADFEALHQELPRLAAQPPAGLKDDILAAVRQSKVTPFQGKQKQWRWRSLASLAAVLVLVVVGGSALRQWDNAASRTGQAPAAGEAMAPDRAQNSAAPAPAAAQNVPEQAAAQEKSGRTLEETSEPTIQVYTEAAAMAGLTQDEAVEKLAQYLGWPSDSLTADGAGVLTIDSADGLKRTITCTGLNEAGTGWVCQVEESASGGPDAAVSCTTYTVPLDGSEIIQP